MRGLSRAALAAVLALAAARCASARPATGGGPPPGYHGVVVLLRPGGGEDTLRVAFAAPWRDTPAGSDTVRAFAGAPAGEGWTAYGRMEGPTLAWGLARMDGDAGSALEMVGTPAPDGAVRGCARPPRRGRPDVRAAFALAPRGAPAPTAADAPRARCRAGEPAG